MARQRSIPTLLLAFGAAAVMMLGGCASTTRIEARDRNVVLPSLRASINFGKGSEVPSAPRDGHAVEIEGFRAKAGDSQALQANQLPIVLDGKPFTPPVQLQHEFRFTYADVAWRWRKFFGGGAVGLDVSAGMGLAGLDLRTRSATLQAARDFSTRGAQGGVGLVWRFQPGTSLQVRAMEFASGDEGVDRISRAEVTLAQALGPYVTGRIGWAGWNVRGQLISGDSAFRLRFSGPTLGLQFDFSP